MKCPSCMEFVANIGTAGRCPHCGAALPLRRSPLAEAAGPVIDGIIVGDAPTPRPSRPTPPALALATLKRPARQRALIARFLWAVGIVVAATIVATLFRLPIAQAFAELAGLRPSYESLEFRAVRTETRRARSGKTLIVEGEVVNRSGEPAELPAIMLTLRASGADPYSWVVEPAAASVPAGGTIRFRSTVAPPDPADGEVALGFTTRTGDIIGMQ